MKALLLLALALACLGTPTAGAQQAPARGHEGCDAQLEDPVALMQIALKVRGVSRDSATPQLAGRNFFSVRPVESAKFIATYFNNASLATLPVSTDPERAAVNIQVGAKTVTYTFLKDCPPAGCHYPVEELIETATLEMNPVFNGSAPYTPWLDNHDGWSIWFLNAGKVANDSAKALLYSDGAIIVRMQIPHTMWTLEFAGMDFEAADLVALNALIDKLGVSEDPDLCRQNNEAEAPPTETLITWTKATFMSANMTAAAQWAEVVLGAVPSAGAYPWPAVEGCEAALWMSIPGSVSLHFVYSQPYLQSMKHSIDALAEDAEQAFLQKVVALGQFEQHMHNSLVLSVDSLDPYLLRLRANSLPFVLARSESQLIAYMVIPGNGIMVELRSAHASVADPIQMGTCRRGSGCQQSFGTFGTRPLMETQVIPKAVMRSEPLSFNTYEHWPGKPWQEAKSDDVPTPALYVAAAHKFAVCAIPKVASSEWLTIFGKLMTNDTSRNDKQEAKLFIEMPTPQVMTDIFSDPAATRVVFVRDPLTRLRSVWMSKCDPSGLNYLDECPMAILASGVVRSPSMKDVVEWVSTTDLSSPSVEAHWMLQSEFCELRHRLAEYNIVGLYSKDHLAADATCIMQMAGISQFNSLGPEYGNAPFWQVTTDKPEIAGAPSATGSSDSEEVGMLKQLLTQDAARKLIEGFKPDYDLFNLPRPSAVLAEATGELYETPVAELLKSGAAI